MVKKLIVSFLFFSGLSYAATGDPDENLRGFDLDPSTRYVRGRFDVKTEGSTHYTVPTRPTEPRIQAVLRYEGLPSPVEEVLLVSGRDGRERVDRTESFPWCLHGQMSMKFEGHTYGGSGILIGPHHFLTAGHCVYKPEESIAATDIRIRLGLNDQVANFGEVLGTKVFIYNQWRSDKNPAFDIALIVLNRSIGHETGWAGLLCLDDKELKDHRIHVTGYPGDKGFRTLWTMDDKISRVEREKLYYNIDTFGGQSGGAIWINKWGMPYVLGNHAYGGTLSDGGNFGTRLSQKKITDIVKQIRDTFVIDEAPRRTALVAPAAGAGGGSASSTRPADTTGPTRPSASTSGGGGGTPISAGTWGAGSASRPLATVSLPRVLSTVPPVVIDQDEEYRRFLDGILVYKPNRSTDEGKIEIPFRSLANPLGCAFDLADASKFGDTGLYISIHTGYKKEKNPDNADKVEIWVTPKFLVERELGGTAGWMTEIISSWSAPYGLIWTWGNNEVKNDNFDYLLNGDVLSDNGKNLYEKWEAVESSPAITLQRKVGFFFIKL